MKESKGITYTQENGYNPVVFWITLLVAVVIHVALYIALGEHNIAFLSRFSEFATSPKHPNIQAAINVMDPENPFQSAREPGREYEVDVDSTLENMHTETPGSVFVPPRAAFDFDEPENNPALTPPSAAELEKNAVAPWVPREQIAIVERDIIFDKPVPFERMEIPAIERMSFAPDFAPAYVAAASVEEANKIGKPAYVAPPPPQTDERGINETVGRMLESGGDRKMPEGVEAGPEAKIDHAIERFVEIPADHAPAEPIEAVLNANASVYKPRRSDGHQYFQIDVTRKSADILPRIPRDILLVQDSSGSLGMERLHLCKRAINKIVANLNPEDRFNILEFSTENRLCFGAGWRSPDADSIKLANDFVNTFKSEGNTDIFNALKGALDLPRDPDRVMLVIFITDGVVTSGQVRRDTEIIAEFARLNAGAVSVFNLGVHPKSNEFLLSMLSFQNRGGQASIVSDRFQIEKEADIIAGTTFNPVLTDISFMFGSDTGAVVTPRTISNLYLDRPMRIYGRVPADAKQVVFQALGRTGGKKYDMIFNIDLTAAATGKEEIQTNWAKTRIFDLISEHTVSPSPDLLREINELGRRHNIDVPFKDKL